MAEHDQTWARVFQMARNAYPDEPDLAALHATEVFDAEQTAAYTLQAEQLDAEAAAGEADVQAARAEVAEGRAIAQMGAL